MAASCCARSRNSFPKPGHAVHEDPNWVADPVVEHVLDASAFRLRKIPSPHQIYASIEVSDVAHGRQFLNK